MADQPGWYLLAIVVTVLWVAGAAAQRLWRVRGQRRDQRRITATGQTVTGEVIEVAGLNRRSGHPVTVAFTDQTGFRRQLRDDSGLSGYLVRVGQQVILRYVLDDPTVARIEQVLGPRGPYPVRQEGRATGPSLLPPVVALVAAVVMVPVYFLEPDVFAEVNLFNVLPPLFGLVGLGVLAAGIGTLRSEYTRPEQLAEATGVVTDVWSERVRSQRNSSIVHPFTVHFAAHDGREVHARASVASSFRPQPGQPVRVRYRIDFPPRFRVAEQRAGAMLLAVVPIAMGLVFTGIGVAWLVVRLALL